MDCWKVSYLARKKVKNSGWNKWNRNEIVRRSHSWRSDWHLNTAATYLLDGLEEGASLGEAEGVLLGLEKDGKKGSVREVESSQSDLHTNWCCACRTLAMTTYLLDGLEEGASEGLALGEVDGASLGLLDGVEDGD